MENYEIRDARLLLEQAEQLSSINNSIANLREQMDACISQIKNAWSSDTADRDSYLSGITANLVKLERLNSAISTLAANLNSFANESINIANS